MRRGTPTASDATVTCGPRAHVIDTERLVVQSSAPGDFERLLGLLDETASYWNGWTGLPRLELERIFATADFPLRARHSFVIIERATGALVGERTFARHRSHGMVSCGSWMISEARGRGYGTEELSAFVEFVHRHLGYRVVASQTDEDNVAARRQMEKAGLSLLGDADTEVRLANGRVATGVTYVHVDARTERSCHVPEDGPEGWLL